MRVYFIDKIHDKNVAITATSLIELESKVISYSCVHALPTNKIKVHCSHICSFEEHSYDVDFIVEIDDIQQVATTTCTNINF